MSTIVSLWHFDTIFQCAESLEDLIDHMEDPNVMWKFAAFSVKTYMLLLKNECAFVLPFQGSLVLAGPHAKEKCACDQLANICVQICVCMPVDVDN